jgi:hypothetical protein
MKNYMNKIIILLLSVLALTGCDNYNDRTEVLPEITANHKSLTIFIGGEAQIVASPQDGTSFTWTSASPDVATVSEDGLVKALSEGSSDITVRKGDAFIIISVIVIPKIPLTNIELSTYDVKMKIGDHSIVQIVSTPTEANDIPMNDFWWWSDDETIATVNAEGEITGMSLGSTQIHYRRGDLVRTVDVSVLFFLSNSTPFMGPHILSQATPLTLWACNFDFGGEGVGFHDGDTNNQGNFAYRANNGDPNSPGVDIENGNGNPNGIGYTAAGEWLIYTVEVEDAGIYSFQLEGAGTGTSSFYLEVDGVNQTGNISFSSTGGWSNWAWAYTNNSVELNLSEGTHWIKFYFVSAASNIRAYKFTYLRPN